MRHEDGLRVRRTRRTYEALEMQALEGDMEACGAYISSGRGYWRGLSGRDPLAEISDEEYGLREFEDWNDAALDEDERPQRRRPSGREVDIVPPVVGEVTVRVDPSIAAAYAARQVGAAPGASWDVDNSARVTIVGDFKVWQGACAQCCNAFEQRRPRSQRRRWQKLCSEECRELWNRGRARDRMRRVRGSDAA
ncbi:hypothetical protein ACFYWX_10660 [Streptomyces sp. NPDC002888]|uniref:hypothetical protein n=1 Tax=Streptomyces sp. NPDC002888 TaxID=3364668 RepID=UPI0036B52281